MSILRIDLPQFFVHAHRRSDPSLSEKPIFVHRDKVVLEACERALALGIKPGMGVTEVRSMHGDELVSLPYSEDVYAAPRREWLENATHFSDEIEPVSPQGAFLDLSPHPFPALIAERFLKDLRKRGYAPRAALSPTKWVAEAMLPKAGLREILIPGMELVRVSVHQLLPVAPAIRQRLEFLGYRRIGEVQRLSLETLQSQFPAEAMIIQRAAMGNWSESVRAEYPLHSVAVRWIFQGAVEDQERVDVALQELARQLAVRLSERDEQGNQLELWVTTEEGSETPRTRIFSRPMARKQAILTGLRYLWEATSTEGKVCEIRARMRDLKHVSRRQTILPGLPLRDEQAGEVALGRIRQKFGETAVLTASEVQIPRRKAVLRAWNEAVGWY